MIAAASTGMGNRRRAGKPSQYFTEPPRPTQPPTLSGTRYEGRAAKVRWQSAAGSKGRYGSFCWCINVWWQVKICDPSLTRAIPERLRDAQLVIKCYTNKASFTFTFTFPEP